MISLDFDRAGGLVPVVVQDEITGEVLMLAYMNATAWERTLATGKATFWSRSRQSLWVKGETSGNFQEVREIRIDCDLDAVVLKVHQRGGAACHTGYRSCFYRKVGPDGIEITGERIFNPEEVYR